MHRPPRTRRFRPHVPFALSVLIVATLVSAGESPAVRTSPRGEPEWIRQERLLLHGGDLNPEQVKALGALVANDPNNLDARLQLLGYYFHDPSESGSSAVVEQVIWFVKNQPGLTAVGRGFFEVHPRLHGPEAYDSVRALWLQAVEASPTTPEVLANAAAFFMAQDQSLAEDLLKRAERLDPNNSEWPRQLAHLYSREQARRRPATGSEAGEKSLQKLEEAAEKEGGEGGELGKFFMLPDLAKAAFAAGEFQKARDYGLQLLDKGSWPEFFREAGGRRGRSTGNFTHFGNLVLGRLALRDGDVEKAKTHLVESARIDGSPQLNSFGPNMTLAKELLEKGEKQAVLQYFELCGKFWEMGHERLDAWAAVVKQGEIPDFGANLAY